MQLLKNFNPKHPLTKPPIFSMKNLLFFIIAFIPFVSFAQTGTDELDNLMGNDAPTTEYVNNAFKSSRVINGHSMEMLGEGVLDFRILHRFGIIKNGLKDLFGLDQAKMRMGFDYGITKDLTVGIGRSTLNKELDGFVKYRILHQQTGKKNIPVSLIGILGTTIRTAPFTHPAFDKFENRMGYYAQAIVGRKINENFTLQIAPTFVHRNLVELKSDNNNMIAIGIGGRAKISRRTAIVLDMHPIISGARPGFNKMPLSIGFDIETGGHVFQLHLSNSRGMNEKAFITETHQDWGKGEFQIGFNLSRVFTVKKNTKTSW